VRRGRVLEVEDYYHALLFHFIPESDGTMESCYMTECTRIAVDKGQYSPHSNSSSCTRHYRGSTI
jgi:hypothetical protein